MVMGDFGTGILFLGEGILAPDLLLSVNACGVRANPVRACSAVGRHQGMEPTGGYASVLHEGSYVGSPRMRLELC